MTCLTMTDDYHDYHKWILKIFEMSILTKIVVVTRRDIRLTLVSDAKDLGEIGCRP